MIFELACMFTVLKRLKTVFDNTCVLYLQVKPLIWIESVIEKHSHSRIEYMIKAGHFCTHVIYNIFIVVKPLCYNYLERR